MRHAVAVHDERTQTTAVEHRAAYFIPTVVVPMLLITHGLMFRNLVQGDRVPKRGDKAVAA